MKILFLTFGDGTLGFRQAGHRLCKQFSDQFPGHKSVCATMGLLRELDPVYWNGKEDFLKDNPRGFGNWIWKPALINLAFRQAFGAFDVLVYLDAGCELNFRTEISRAKFSEYLSESSIQGGLAFSHKENQFGITDFSEQKWTKPSLIEFLSPGSEILESPQLQAGCFFLTKDASSFVKDWFEISNHNDSQFLIDQSAPNHYIHRNDQSIFSLLWKQTCFSVIEDQTFFDFQDDETAFRYPIWTARNSSSRSLTDKSMSADLVRAFESKVSQFQFFLRSRGMYLC